MPRERCHERDATREMTGDTSLSEKMVTISLPVRLIRFVWRFYGLWCGALWLVLFFSGSMSLAYMRPGLSPRENPATSDIAMIGGVCFLLGAISMVYGGIRIVQMVRQADRRYVPHAVAFAVALPVIVFLASAGLIHFMSNFIL